MKCLTHPESESSAICIHCGRALCSVCITKSQSQRVVCSPQCAAALLKTEQSLESVRKKSVSSLRSTGWFLIAVSVVFLVFAALVHRELPLLGPFLFPCGVVFVVTGFVFIRLARRKEQQDAA
jgi:hypothetical protein